MDAFKRVQHKQVRNTLENAVGDERKEARRKVKEDEKLIQRWGLWSQELMIHMMIGFKFMEELNQSGVDTMGKAQGFGARLGARAKGKTRCRCTLKLKFSALEGVTSEGFRVLELCWCNLQFSFVSNLG